jgi:hypothetical protein
MRYGVAVVALVLLAVLVGFGGKSAAAPPTWLRVDSQKRIDRDWPPNGTFVVRYERHKLFTDAVVTGRLGCGRCSRPAPPIATWYRFVILHYVNATRQMLVDVGCDDLSRCRSKLRSLGVE